MTKTEHYNPHGISLLDFHNGDREAVISVIDDLGQRFEVPVRLFFRGWAELPALERAALDLCRGRVLEIGAGSGGQTLILQERGLSVCALDFLAECVEVMRRRGVREAVQADIHTFESAERFDTLLSLMNGIAMVGGLDGLQPFLKSIRRLLKPGGQFLFDSTDLRLTSKPQLGALLKKREQQGRYFGEQDLQLEYKSRPGTPFTQLCVDAETMAAHAAQAGWSCEIITRDECRYLARLTLREA